MKQQFVIAHYDETLDWLGDLPEGAASFVYHKHESAIENHLPNVGREAHTYLQHILNHYDRLADQTIFLQGRPHDHILNSPEGLQEVFSQIPDDAGFYDLGTVPLIEDETGSPSHRGLCLSDLYRELFVTDPPAYFSCRAGANFAVSRETIRQHTREDYERFQQLLLASLNGPWEFERMWPHLFRSVSSRRGVVTAADAGFFSDLKWMLCSLRKVSKTPVEVFDLGLTDEQLDWLKTISHCQIRSMPRLVNRLERIRTCPMWQTWLKPIYLLMSDFDACLWIDGDCIVLDDLHRLFEAISRGPLLCPDLTDAAVENRAELYDWLPADNDWCERSLRVNAGTIGLDKRRDHELLAAWAWAVLFAARNLRLARLFRWFDQGALHWALHRLGREDLVSPESRWCVPYLEERNIVTSSIRNRQSLTESLRSQFPESSIVHFLGEWKLSRQLRESIEL